MVFVIFLAFIIFMLVKKDVAEIYATAPSGQIVPLIATTIIVAVLKIAAIAGVIFC